MNGFIKATVAGLCLGTGFTTLVGCDHYRQIVDPCWPERYNAEARLSVRDTFGAQAHNGHVLDQTVWNYQFEVDARTGMGTDKLTVAGMEHLKYLARRQPVPDPNLFLQTAQDVAGAATMPLDKLAQTRSDLDNKRVAAIQKYMASLVCGRSHATAFDVAIIDPPEVGIAAIAIGGNVAKPVIKGSIPQYYENFKGKVDKATTSGGGGGGGGGSAPGGI